MFSKDKNFDPAILDLFEEKMPGMDKDLYNIFVQIVTRSVRMLGLLDHYLGLYGLSRGRFQILLHLFINKNPDGVVPSELAHEMGLTSATITGLVDTLEKADLVARNPDKSDRRRVKIKMTAMGEKLLRSFLPYDQENKRMFLSALSSEERLELINLLETMNSAIESRVHELESSSDSNFLGVKK